MEEESQEESILEDVERQEPTATEDLQVSEESTEPQEESLALPTDEDVGEPEEQEDVIPIEIEEIDTVIETLRPIAVACEFLIPIMESREQQQVQLRLKHYGEALSNTPKALQVLNDIRRHIPRIEQEASDVRALLIDVRGGEEDALSSEETRVIVACASIRETVIAAINNLEGMFTHIRQTSHALITLISHEEPGFLESAQQALPTLRPDLISNTVHAEMGNLYQLREDLLGLYELRAHAEGLVNV